MEANTHHTRLGDSSTETVSDNRGRANFFDALAADKQIRQIQWIEDRTDTTSLPSKICGNTLKMKDFFIHNQNADIDSLIIININIERNHLPTANLQSTAYRTFLAVNVRQP